MEQNIIYYIMWILWDIIDLICIYRVMHVMFDMPKRKPGKRIIAYFVLYIVITLLQPFARQSEGLFGMLMYVPYYIKAFPIICECLQSKSKGYTLVNIWMYEVLLNFGAETISALRNETYQNYTQAMYSLIITYFIISLFVCIGTIFVEIMRKTKQISLYFSSLSLLTYIFLSMSMYSIIAIETWVFSIRIYTERIMRTLEIMLIVLIVSFIGLVISLFSTSKKRHSIQKTSDLLAEQIGSMTAYYEQMSKKDEELRRFKHDSRNLLSGLYSMLEKSEVEQAKEYIKNMEDIYQVNINDFNCGNSIADAIMSTKKNFASQYKISIDFEGLIPEHVIKDTDMCIFLANALDNAIEACQKVQAERYIYIKSQIVKKMWIIVVSNPVNKKIEIVDNMIETTKEDKAMHGYGLLNMRHVVEKYSGQMKIGCEKNEFILKTSFMIQQDTN